MIRQQQIEGYSDMAVVWLVYGGGGGGGARRRAEGGERREMVY